MRGCAGRGGAGACAGNPGPARAPAMAQAAPAPQRTHSFAKKTFHKPTYCHHCSDLLWGLIGQGYGCEGVSRKVSRVTYSSRSEPCRSTVIVVIDRAVLYEVFW
ncbi:hypothetical protein KGM_204108 [Danaus plexippus plexippus]|uniref:Phorbol-ester/DAG-type domain-containing protein n=1 Tax=Danaus plexippus plexippus TaxID=278856 RepID=A0A212ELZ3_DANPL|nr:hypothetical protein KGM_204108 [Danaus plexippus plexippus]